MAVKFRLPDGSATDLLGQTSPRFPTDTPEEFVALTEATEQAADLAAVPASGTRGWPAQPRGQHPGKAVASAVSFAEVTFYPIHAYGWLAEDGTRTWVRYIFRPPPPRPTGWRSRSRAGTGWPRRWRPGSRADR